MDTTALYGDLSATTRHDLYYSAQHQRNYLLKVYKAQYVLIKKIHIYLSDVVLPDTHFHYFNKCFQLLHESYAADPNIELYKQVTSTIMNLNVKNITNIIVVNYMVDKCSTNIFNCTSETSLEFLTDVCSLFV